MCVSVVQVVCFVLVQTMYRQGTFFHWKTNATIVKTFVLMLTHCYRSRCNIEFDQFLGTKKCNKKIDANRVKHWKFEHIPDTQRSENYIFSPKTVFYSQPNMGILRICSNFDPHFSSIFYSSRYNSTFLFLLRSRMQRRVWARNHILV